MSEFPVHEMEEYVTGMGQRLRVHTRACCKGDTCVIHNPSNHNMRDWPTYWRDDRKLMERICPHGIGHPDPVHIEFTRLKRGEKFAHYEAVHGCDGCCVPREVLVFEDMEQTDLEELIEALEEDKGTDGEI